MKMCLHKDLHINFTAVLSVVARMSINRWMDIQIIHKMGYNWAIKKIHYGYTQQHRLTSNNCVEWKKSDKKKDIVYNFTYRKLQKIWINLQWEKGNSLGQFPGNGKEEKKEKEIINEHKEIFRDVDMFPYLDCGDSVTDVKTHQIIYFKLILWL